MITFLVPMLWLVGYVAEPVIARQDLIEAISSTYTANLKNVKFGTVRFRLINGKTRNIETARRGEFSNEAVAQGLYVFDGQLGRYECVFPIETMVAHRERTGESNWWTRLDPSVRAVTNGRLSLCDVVYVASDDQTPTHTAQIEGGTEAYTVSIGLACAPGAPHNSPESLDGRIQSALRDHAWTIHLEEHVSLDGVDTTLITFDNGKPAPEWLAEDFWVDLQRGALPLRIRSRSGKDRDRASTEVYYDDIRQVDQQCWLPFRVTFAITDDPYARQYVIDEADFTNRPPKSSYSLEFPWEIPMINAAAMIRYAPRKVWDLANLPGPNSKETTKFQLQEPAAAPPPALPGERTARSWGSILPWFAVGLVLLGGGGVLAWRHRHG